MSQRMHYSYYSIPCRPSCFQVAYLQQRVRAICRLLGQQDEHAELLIHIRQLQDLEPELRNVVVRQLLHLVHHLDLLCLILTHGKPRKSPSETASCIPASCLYICKLHLVDFEGHLFGVRRIKAVQPVSLEVDGINQSQPCHRSDRSRLQKIFNLI